MTQTELIESINLLADFCGKRDIPELSREALQKAYGIQQADLLILFGGSIPCGCDVAAQAFLGGCAKRLMIVGGEGHTTESLRQKIKEAYPEIPVDGKTESEMMAAYLKLRYGIEDILLETESTNCGNNVTNTLDVLQKNGLAPQSIIIIQDATMQRRMQAGFERDWKMPCRILINFAAYRVQVQKQDDETLTFQPSDLWGMWEMDRYLTLLMGEIPRLTDDENGYGPQGKGYIAHVDVPEQVRDAFERLKENYSGFIRQANPAYASKE